MKNNIVRSTLAGLAGAATFATYFLIAQGAFTSSHTTFGSQAAMMTQAAARYDRQAQ